MKKFLLLVMPLILFANFTDNDLDGVDDSVDKCLNTPFNAIVDKYGCTKRLLNFSKKEKNIDFFTELSSIKDEGDSSISQLLFLGISKSSYYFSFSALINDIEDKKSTSDVTFKIKKYINFKNFRFGGGFGLKIPTKDFDTNKLDIPFYLSLSYDWKMLSFFSGATYTIINDKSKYFDYKNTKFGYVGVSLYQSNFLESLSYSIDLDRYNETSKTLSLSLSYIPKSSYYFYLGIDKGLNSYATDYIYSIGIGKKF